MKKSQIDKYNKMLNDLEDRKLTTSKIEAIKHDLELLNADIGKRGKQDRFSKSKNLFKVEENILENLGKQLEEEYNKINELLNSDEYLKQDDLTEQDYLDLIDTGEEYITYMMERAGLSSDQIRDIFNIVDNKQIKNYRSIIRLELYSAYAQGEEINGYRSIISPDKLSQNIRYRLYQYD